MTAHNAASALAAGEVPQRILVYQDSCQALQRLITSAPMRTPQVRQGKANDRQCDAAEPWSSTARCSAWGRPQLDGLSPDVARVINVDQPAAAADQRLYGMMQHLMATYAHQQAPEKPGPRGLDADGVTDNLTTDLGAMVMALREARLATGYKG